MTGDRTGVILFISGRDDSLEKLSILSALGEWASTYACVWDLCAVFIHTPAVSDAVPALHGQIVALLITLRLVEPGSHLLLRLQLTLTLNLHS